MAKAKIRGSRPGGRNAQFFTNLCRLQAGLDAIIENSKASSNSNAQNAQPSNPQTKKKLIRPN
jgi:hypothetical protein